MRLDRLLPLPAQPPGRREERPPRRQPEPDRAADADTHPDEDRGAATGEGPPDHIDIKV